MSANLLLDLDDFYRPSSSNQSGPTAQQGSLSSTKPAQNASPAQVSNHNLLNDLIPHAGAIAPTEDVEDDFGDFETAAPSVPKPPPQRQAANQGSGPASPIKKAASKKPRNANVLFDAEDEEVSDADDFGDFEGG